MNTTFAFLCSDFMSRAVSVMGVRAMEIQLPSLPIIRFAITDQAGQQEVPINGLSSGTSRTKDSLDQGWEKLFSSTSCTASTSARVMIPNSISAIAFPLLFGQALPFGLGGPEVNGLKFQVIYSLIL